MARVAIVTGGTRGIGEAISIALKDKGMNVAATYAGNDERAREFTERTGIKAYKWDVADHQACADGVKQVEADLGPVDVLVNNAGITRDTLMLRMKPADWDDVIATNLTGTFHCTHAALRPMIKQRSGRIVNVTSVVGLTGNAGQANYAASKAGVVGFTKAVAREVASRA
ncbi:MAG: SDR family NAD(P)-dependent oxidoreductase, partial [Sphingomicrobium sp.]